MLTSDVIPPYTDHNVLRKYKYGVPGPGPPKKMGGIGKGPGPGSHVMKKLICCPTHTDSLRDFILHVPMYLFTFIH